MNAKTSLFNNTIIPQKWRITKRSSVCFAAMHRLIHIVVKFTYCSNRLLRPQHFLRARSVGAAFSVTPCHFLTKPACLFSNMTKKGRAVMRLPGQKTLREIWENNEIGLLLSTAALATGITLVAAVSQDETPHPTDTGNAARVNQPEKKQCSGIMDGIAPFPRCP